MLNIVHQFILNVACIRLALPCHTQLRGHMLFPTGNRVLRLLQTTVSPEVTFETEQVCLIFFLSVFPFSPAGGSGAEAMQQGWGGPAGNAWIRAGERGRMTKPNAKGLLSRFGSRSIQKRAAF